MVAREPWSWVQKLFSPLMEKSCFPLPWGLKTSAGKTMPVRLVTHPSIPALTPERSVGSGYRRAQPLLLWKGNGTLTQRVLRLGKYVLGKITGGAGPKKRRILQQEEVVWTDIMLLRLHLPPVLTLLHIPIDLNQQVGGRALGLQSILKQGHACLLWQRTAC